MPEIFVSYRRSDSVGTAGRLFDRLAERFGADQVFRDLDSIEAGENFEDSIRDALRLAAVVLIVIGPRWLEARDRDGARRLDDPSDYVRREIEMALSSDAVIIPLLVEGAAFPAPESLPPSVRPLTLRNARELSNQHWDSDVRDLIIDFERRLGILPLEDTVASHGERAKQAPSLGQVGVAALAGFVPNLFLLLTQPRRFLARHARGRAPDLLAAVVFFLLSLLLSDLLLIAVYIPRESLLGFYVSGVVIAALAGAAISAPLWLAFRVVGARHYAQIVVVLLHQVAVAHLLLFATGVIMLGGLELRAMNSVGLVLDEALKQPSAEAAFDEILRRLPPLFEGPEPRFASVLAIVVTLAGAIWMIRSWGAYRDALGLSRRQSLGALCVFILTCWAVIALLGWLSSPRHTGGDGMTDCGRRTAARGSEGLRSSRYP